MDYTYLNQAAASFDTNCLQNGIDPMSNMPCTYGDLTSCSQMSQAYRYTAAAASMARSYNPVGSGVGHGSVAAAAAMGSLHHPGPGSQCSVIGARNHHQDVHRASMFSTSMGMQCKFFVCVGNTIFDRFISFYFILRSNVSHLKNVFYNVESIRKFVRFSIGKILCLTSILVGKFTGDIKWNKNTVGLTSDLTWWTLFAIQSCDQIVRSTPKDKALEKKAGETSYE